MLPVTRQKRSAGAPSPVFNSASRTLYCMSITLSQKVLICDLIAGRGLGFGAHIALVQPAQVGLQHARGHLIQSHRQRRFC